MGLPPMRAAMNATLVIITEKCVLFSWPPDCCLLK